MSSKTHIHSTPVAKSTPFDNTTNGFVAADTQAAIEEAVSLGGEASRGGFICGFDGTASTGRWLEFYANNPSDANPAVIAEPGRVRALSISASANSTGTATVYKNAVAIETISLAASKTARKKNLNHAVTDLDLISIQITSGSISRPMIVLYIQTY